MSYVYLPRIVYQQVQDLLTLASERKIEIATDLPEGLPPIHGDPQALGQAVQNVLRNAIVYGAAGSTVRVALGRRDNFLDVAIENEGMGIAAEDLLLDLGRQLDPRIQLELRHILARREEVGAEHQAIGAADEKLAAEFGIAFDRARAAAGRTRGHR